MTVKLKYCVSLKGPGFTRLGISACLSSLFLVLTSLVATFHNMYAEDVSL